MFKVIFYEDKPGASSLYDQIEELGKKSITDKNARVQYNQITYLIKLLEAEGTWLISKYTKPLADDIWELRPGNNRIMYFFFKDDTYVLLHMFRKMTQKTPKAEIEKAKREKKDYLSRHKGD